MKYIGVDTAKPDSDVTAITVPSRRMGKSELLRNLVEQQLDAGGTVAIMSPDGLEVRGAGVARDVTPPKPKMTGG